MWASGAVDRTNNGKKTKKNHRRYRYKFRYKFGSCALVLLYRYRSRLGGVGVQCGVLTGRFSLSNEQPEFDF